MSVRFPFTLLRRGFALFSVEWRLSLAIGMAAQLALLGSCCGFGAPCASWLTCELLRIFLAAEEGRPIARTPKLFAAALLLLVGVLFALGMTALCVVIVNFLSYRGFSLLAFAPIPIVLAITTLYVLPFMFSPTLLLKGGASAFDALLESAFMMGQEPFLKRVWTTFLLHGVQTAPSIPFLMLVVFEAPRVATVAAFVFSLCATTLAFPIGQAAVVAWLVDSRHRISVPRVYPRLGRPLVWAWTTAFMLPVLVLATFGVLFTKSSRIPRGELPAGVTLVEEQRAYGEDAPSIWIQGTSIEIRMDRGAVLVDASDGGGAGRLDLRDNARVEAIRVGRSRDKFGIEIRTTRGNYVTWIDRNGVRADDDLAARFQDRVSLPALVLFGLGLMMMTIQTTYGVRRILRHADRTDERDAGKSKFRSDWISIALVIALYAAALFVTVLSYNA